MKKLILILLLLLIPGCHAEAPVRVVCLYGSYAEAWIAAGGMPIGVTRDAVDERQLELPDDVQIIGTVKEPNLELIVALDPELVIANPDIPAQLAVCETLEAMGIPCALFRVDTWRDFVDMMATFTTLTGETVLYDTLIPPMIAEIEGYIGQSKAYESPRVLLLRAYSTGVRAKGEDDIAGAMLSELGCINIAQGEGSLMEDMSLEAIIIADPDFIFISVMGSDTDAALSYVDTVLGANPAWQALTAVQNGNVYVLPRELFHYKPNLRWSESYAYLSEILFGE